MSFASLGLDAALLSAVKEKGYSQPTPIQKRAIPLILAGRDILASAQTGTGKTAGFTLPLLQRLSSTKPTGRRGAVRALVLTPTRELAMQVNDSVKVYGRNTRLCGCAIYGGAKIGPQIDQLRRGVDVVVATPGRLLDHVSQGTIDLSSVGILVLDEADRMLDMGFINDIRRIIKLLPTDRQTLLFSATFTDEIRRLAKGVQNDPERIDISPDRMAAPKISQSVYEVQAKDKSAVLSHLVREGEWRQVLVFTRTKHRANRVARQLDEDGVSSAAIHGNKSQGARVRALSDFKAGRVRVLVATDIAARGLDIAQLPHVVNFELPNVPEDYVHRIGRTGRAGLTGEAVSLVSQEETLLLRGIEKLLGAKIKRAGAPEGRPSSPRSEQNDAAGRSNGARRPAKSRSARPAEPSSGKQTRNANERRAKPPRKSTKPARQRFNRKRAADSSPRPAAG